MPARINPFWPGKAEQCSPGTAVPGSGKRQRGSAWSMAQATALALKADWVSLPVCPLYMANLFFFFGPLLFCEICRDKWKYMLKE